LIDKLLLERLLLAAIARITGVSERWLQNNVNKNYEEVKREVAVSKKLSNHIGAIGYFIHHYNATLLT
jgi:hypothetical protein